MSDLVFKVTNQKDFAAALKRLLATSKREAEVVMREVARNTVRRIIELTPPGGRTSGAEAKRRGQAKVEGDILKVLEGVPKRQDSGEDPAEVHAGARENGVVPGKARPNRVKVSKAALSAYIRQKKKNVGYLAAGWAKAAKALGYTPPAWINGHRAPGQFKVKVTDREIKITATNAVEYAGNIGVMEKRIKGAIALQAKAINRRVDSAIAKAASKAGFKNG